MTVDHAVIAHFPFVEDAFGSERGREIVAELADTLRDAIEEGAVGKYDGEEFGGGRCVLYMYGPDADRLFAVVEPILRAEPLTRGGFAIKRYAAATSSDEREIRVNL